MTIVEAMKANKIDRITFKNRWLYWADAPQYGIEKNNWVVRESRRGGKGPLVIIITEDEEAAIEALIGETDETHSN